MDNPDLVISVITEGSDGSSSGKAVAIAGGYFRCLLQLMRGEKRCRQNFSVIYMSAKAGKRKTEINKKIAEK